MACDHSLPAIPEREPRPPPIATLRSWEPWPFENAHLLGHCAIIFSGGWQINGIPAFKRRDGSISVGVPNSPDIDRDGRVKTDATGKRLYRPLIQFATDAARQRWNGAVLAALRDAGIAPGTSGDAP